MKKLFVLFLFAFLAVGSLTVVAQTTNPDIYTHQNGDLWKYNISAGTAQQLTQSGYNGGPILSPDGRTIAYLEASSDIVIQVNAGTASQSSGSPPADVWIFDIASQSFNKIADQSGASSAGILRSLPAWSPDSRQLAWLQIDPGIQSLEQATLQVYRLDSATTVSLAYDVNLGYQTSDIRMPNLQWGGGGIARLLFAFLYGNQSPFLFLEVFNPNNAERTQFNLELAPDKTNLVRDFIWADHLGHNVVLLRINDYWEILDPLDGSRARLSEPPRLKNRFVSGGLELIPQTTARDGGGWEIQWQALSDTSRYDTGYLSLDVDIHLQPALSGDGSQMAWHNGERVSIWHLGMATENRPLASDAGPHKRFPVPDPISLVWAPTEWVTTGIVATVQTAPTQVPNPTICALAPHLSAGQQAIVSPGLANRVRSAASLNAEVVGNIDAGEVVNVVLGPVCNSGYYWYSVENQRISGWTVEGIDGDYWLLYHIDCSDSPPTNLGKGMTATVSAGQANNIRDGIGTSGTSIIGTMSAGENFEITGYPQCDADGLRWYPIQYNDIAGWTASGQGDVYWIEPATGQSTG